MPTASRTLVLGTAISIAVHGAILSYPVASRTTRAPDSAVSIEILARPAPPTAPLPATPRPSPAAPESAPVASETPPPVAPPRPVFRPVRSARGRADSAARADAAPPVSGVIAADEAMDSGLVPVSTSRSLGMAQGVALSALDGLPTQVAVAAAAAPGPAGGLDRAAYARRVRSQLERQKRYPERALRRGVQGVVTLRLIIGNDGSLARAPRVVRSSGASALDREAVRMARAAAPFGPTGSPRPITVSVPVRFSLSAQRGWSQR